MWRMERLITVTVWGIGPSIYMWAKQGCVVFLARIFCWEAGKGNWALSYGTDSTMYVSVREWLAFSGVQGFLFLRCRIFIYMRFFFQKWQVLVQPVSAAPQPPKPTNHHNWLESHQFCIVVALSIQLRCQRWHHWLAWSLASPGGAAGLGMEGPWYWVPAQSVFQVQRPRTGLFWEPFRRLSLTLPLCDDKDVVRQQIGVRHSIRNLKIRIFHRFRASDIWSQSAKTLEPVVLKGTAKHG